MKYLLSKITAYLIIGMMLFLSCQSNTSAEALDLMKYGMAIKINAPADSEIKSEDLGFMKDVTVKAGEKYSIQITSSDALQTEPKKIAEKLLQEVKRDIYFDSVIEEGDDGFVYKKNIDGQEDYDFRHVRISGNTEYIFQTALIGTFGLDDVKTMYESVQ